MVVDTALGLGVPDAGPREPGLGPGLWPSPVSVPRIPTFCGLTFLTSEVEMLLLLLKNLYIGVLGGSDELVYPES